MKQHKDIQLLIVPDVHGRSFWKGAVDAHPDVPVIFLGDYLDQYGDEHIHDHIAISVLGDIISLKRQRPDKVFLCLGNHDLSYLDSRFHCSRHHWLDEYEYAKLLRDHRDLFDLAYDMSIAGKRFLFSHAGVSKGWLSLHEDLFSDKPISGDLFSQMFKCQDTRDGIFRALCDVSVLRWGMQRYGSMVWADVEEMMDPLMQIDGVIQVFGHSQQDVEPCCLKDHAYCLDCRKVFYIDSAGDIRDYDSDRIVGEDRYIFLDVDGVLTSGRSHYMMDPVCQSYLGEILDKTDARIVVSSSWKGSTVKETNDHLTSKHEPLLGDYPFPFGDKIVGVTIDWPRVDDDFTRGREIDAYLKLHSCRSYVILDDVLDFTPDQDKYHLAYCHDSVGIDADVVKRAVDILLKG